MNEGNLNDEELEKLREVNELKKLKLALESGAIFSDSESMLSPELENEWLTHIEQFEKGHQNSKIVKIDDYAGNPEFRNESEIPDSEIEFELKKILDKLLSKGIVMETICDIEPRILYRFITEEFLKGETDDFTMEGYTSHYIYEEYHPNHDYDIRSHSLDFIRSLLNKENDFYTYVIAGKPDENLKNQTYIKEIFENNLILFRNSFDSFFLNNFEIKKVDFGLENAKINFELSYSGKMEGSNDTSLFSGEGTFDLIYQWDFWSISKVNMPGLNT